MGHPPAIAPLNDQRYRHARPPRVPALELHTSQGMSPTSSITVQDWVGHQPQLAWENDSMAFIPTSLRSTRAKAVLIVALVIALAVSTWIAPPHAVVLHNVLHHLNILPLMLAGMFFGWRGALKTVLLATVLQAPSIYRNWFHMPLDAQDQIVELSTFAAAGVIAGLLSDRERMQRKRVEDTKAELEQVHMELRQNIEHLKKTERLTAAGQLSASLAHEIRNPLASISGAAGILSRGQASAGDRRECLDILTKESQRLNKLLTNFLDFARPRLPRMQSTDSSELLRAIVMLAQHSAAQQHVTLEVLSEDRGREIECDPEQIKQLLDYYATTAVPVERIQHHCGLTKDEVTQELADRGRRV